MDKWPKVYFDPCFEATSSKWQNQCKFGGHALVVFLNPNWDLYSVPKSNRFVNGALPKSTGH